MHFPARPAHEISIVEESGLGAVSYAKVYKVRQDPQAGSVPLRRPYVEGGTERPVVWNMIGNGSENQRQTDASPTPHYFTIPAFNDAVGQRVLLSTCVTSISVRERIPGEAVICGQ
jgi:hypothetical protein